MSAISSMRAAIAGTLTKEGAKAVDRMFAQMKARTEAVSRRRSGGAGPADDWPNPSGEV